MQAIRMSASYSLVLSMNQSLLAGGPEMAEALTEAGNEEDDDA